MHRLTKTIVEVLAKMYLARFKPMIIAVTGNAGKTSTKEAIGAVVRKIKTVRMSSGNLNDEVGVPFNIISSSGGQYIEKGGGLLFGAMEFFKAIFGLLRSDYPEVLVLEYGADKPGDIQKLVEKYKPHISVVTTVGDTPVHVEFFSAKGGSASGGKDDADKVADEKANLVSVLGVGDYAVLNHDDQRVLAMKAKTKAKVLTYGFDLGSTIRASDVEYMSNDEGRPLGVSFKLNEGSRFAPVRIEGSLGKSQAWSASASAVVGTILGMNLVEISEALSAYHGPKGRLKILRGINNSNIIDDTYNASPASTRLALETLRDVPALRKIAVLGDMLELGEHSERAHREIGVLASEITDVLVCVGPRAKAIADSARSKLTEVYTFENSNEAKAKVHELVHEHDLILVKGSQGARMERIVKEILAEPAQAKNLLVRQSRRWLSK
jgi:UDP-N-acetylmuramoyl-tripeptide--D-alanyl-D-alanine ligase